MCVWRGISFNIIIGAYKTHWRKRRASKRRKNSRLPSNQRSWKRETVAVSCFFFFFSGSFAGELHSNERTRLDRQDVLSMTTKRRSSLSVRRFHPSVQCLLRRWCTTKKEWHRLCLPVTSLFSWIVLLVLLFFSSSESTRKKTPVAIRATTTKTSTKVSA